MTGVTSVGPSQDTPAYDAVKFEAAARPGSRPRRRLSITYLPSDAVVAAGHDGAGLSTAFTVTPARPLLRRSSSPAVPPPPWTKSTPDGARDWSGCASARGPRVLGIGRHDSASTPTSGNDCCPAVTRLRGRSRRRSRSGRRPPWAGRPG